ncbi:MAG: flagellar basal body P-ring protein FlgI [Planctomycetaceae bacterium]|nr:flagellar basal body P-ring protein FlgI [Planctomycetaceae bacterium]
MLNTSLKLVVFAIITSCLLCGARSVEAQVKLESICTLDGHEKVRLIGMGLVVGLNGTGDAGAGPTIRALAAAMEGMETSVPDIKELKNASNVAIVMVHATIPAMGVNKGQRIDCFISSYLSAKSLKDGRLFVTPLRSEDKSNKNLIGIAEGPVLIEGGSSPTSGRISGGVVIKDEYYLNENYLNRIVHISNGKPVIRLLLDPSHQSFIAARDIAERINELNNFETFGEETASPISASMIEVLIPEIEQNNPILYIAEIMSQEIASPHTISTVRVNSKTGIVIASGDITISPALINLPNLQVDIVGENPSINGAAFKPLGSEQSTRATAKLNDLVDALNKLGVPREEMINVLRQLHNSGKLHAKFIEVGS